MTRQRTMTPEEVRAHEGKTKRTELARRLERDMEAAGIPTPVKEYHFHPTRKWAFDYAWPDRNLAVEVDGGVFAQGRHQRPMGVVNDNDKLNEAARLGWTVLRFTRIEIMGGRVKKGTRKGCECWPGVCYCMNCPHRKGRKCGHPQLSGLPGIPQNLPVYEQREPCAVEQIKCRECWREAWPVEGVEG